jgi:hypothetical protein
MSPPSSCSKSSLSPLVGFYNSRKTFMEGVFTHGHKNKVFKKMKHIKTIQNNNGLNRIKDLE